MRHRVKSGLRIRSGEILAFSGLKSIRGSPARDSRVGILLLGFKGKGVVAVFALVVCFEGVAHLSCNSI